MLNNIIHAQITASCNSPLTSTILFTDKGSKVDECRDLELFMVGNKERALTDADGLRHSSGWAKEKAVGLESTVEYGVMT